MADTKLQKKYREAAKKLSSPKPRELPSGNWRCEIMVKGKKISVVESDPSVAHARALAMKAGILQKREEDQLLRRGSLSLTKAIDKYIEARENVLSPSTVRGYKEIQKNRFPGLMEKQVNLICATDVQMAVNEDAKKVSAKTIKNAVALVSSVISEYQPIDLGKLRLPQRKRKEHAYLTESQLIDFFDAIRGDLVELPLLMAVWLGMRRSEIMGLCWDSIDFEKKTLRIQRTYIKDKDGNYVLRDALKTEASRRVLDCPDYILSKLSEYTPLHRSGRVFTMHPNTLYKNMKKTCEAANIEFVGVHGLRHTNASVMLSLGIVDKIAMARGGWSTDVTMKQVYQHLFPADVATASDKMDAFFQGVLTGQPKKKSSHKISHENKKDVDK